MLNSKPLHQPKSTPFVEIIPICNTETVADKSNQETQPSPTQASTLLKKDSPDVSSATRSNFIQRTLALIKRKSEQKPQDDNEPSGFLAQKSTRRAFLRGAAKGGLGLAAAVVTGAIPDVFPYEKNTLLNYSPARKQNLPPRPEDLPDDVLTEEELKTMNITINQTERVQLFMRRSSLDMQLFKDAAEGANGGVVISLVDSESLNWDAIDKLPPDARLVWQSLDDHPLERPERYWQELQKYTQEQEAYLINNGKYLEERLGRILSGEAEKDAGEAIALYQRIIARIRAREGPMSEEIAEEVKKATDSLNYWNDQLEEIKSGLAEAETRKRIADNIKDLEENEKDKRALQNETERIERFAQKGDANGQFIDGPKLNELDTKHAPTATWGKRLEYVKKQGWTKKKYIYICVGGPFNPDPKHSYPTPSDFKEGHEEVKKTMGYHVLTKSGDFLVGFTLRHEIGHNQVEGKTKNEEESSADSWALVSIAASAKSGDYPFIFANEKGLTFTKRQMPEANSANL